MVWLRRRLLWSIVPLSHCQWWLGVQPKGALFLSVLTILVLSFEFSGRHSSARQSLRLSLGSMEAIGPDEVDEEELKRAKTWRDIRAELTRGVKPSWSGKGTTQYAR